MFHPALSDQPDFDHLVGRPADPLPFVVEVGVFRALDRGLVRSVVVALVAALTVIPMPWLPLVFFLSLKSSVGSWRSLL